MTNSDQTPKLPTWLFIVADLALLGLAGVIAAKAPQPYSSSTTLAIVLLGLGGLFAGLVPLVARYERLKNETLDDRQRALEALARTVASSAEQISIAANGLHEIAELSQKNLRQAELLAPRLQEKIDTFKSQLSTAHDADRQKLEREIAALRTSESQRLEAIAAKLAQVAADWSTLETTTQKNLAAAQEAIASTSRVKPRIIDSSAEIRMTPITARSR